MRGAPKTPLRVAREARALARISREAGRIYGGSPLRVAPIARRVRSRQAFEYEEALRSGLLDPAMPDAERARWVSRLSNLEAQAPLNNGNEPPPVTLDKATFSRLCSALGVPVPRLLGVIDVRASSWSATGRVWVGRRGLADFLREDVPAEIFIKPSAGWQGRGARALTRRDDGSLVDGAGRTVGLDALWDDLRSDPEFPVWVVQERMRNHPELVRIAGDDSLHGVRVATLVGPDGVPELLYAVLKLALSGGDSDNFLSGRSGNAAVEVDVATGRLGQVIVPAPGRAGWRRSSDNPLTGAPVEGTVLPHWREATETVLRAAPHFLPSRALGWDVALTPDGPRVLETNIRWLIFPTPEMPEILRRLRAASGMRDGSAAGL